MTKVYLTQRLHELQKRRELLTAEIEQIESALGACLTYYEVHLGATCVSSRSLEGSAALAAESSDSKLFHRDGETVTLLAEVKGGVPEWRGPVGLGKFWLHAFEELVHAREMKAKINPLTDLVEIGLNEVHFDRVFVRSRRDQQQPTEQQGSQP